MLTIYMDLLDTLNQCTLMKVCRSNRGIAFGRSVLAHVAVFGAGLYIPQQLLPMKGGIRQQNSTAASPTKLRCIVQAAPVVEAVAEEWVGTLGEKQARHICSP